MTSTTTPQILSVGEVLWDLFPEAARFGGAPANLACHAAALGCQVSMVSRVGKDPYGHEATVFLADHQVATQLLQVDAEAPTGTVKVVVDSAGKPSYEIVQGVAWDRLAWEPALAEAASRALAVCFGTLAQRSAQSAATIHRLLRETAPTALKLLDLNLRMPFYDRTTILASLNLANGLKLNDEELLVLAKLLGLGAGEDRQIDELCQRFDLRLLAVTRGSQGSLVCYNGMRSELGPSPPVTIADTVGAGDSFTAAMVSGLLRDVPIDVVHRRAADVAAFVCTQHGAVPQLPYELAKWDI